MMQNEQISVAINTLVNIDLSWCPPGSFSLATRGTSLFSKVKKETVRVEFSKGFWMGSTPVTESVWNAVLGNDARNRFKEMTEEHMPVYGIDYREANLFLHKLNGLMKDAGQHFHFSLPNYLEWQYACEAKTGEGEARYWNDKDFAEYAWFKENSGSKVRKVAGRHPNPWGLYDMYGNIYEACVDVHAEPGIDTIVDPVSMVDVEVLDVLGGCYQSSFEQCQWRYGIATENSFVEPLGIRLMCTELK